MKVKYRSLLVTHLRRELHVPRATTPVIWFDSQNTIVLAYKHIFHLRLKHIEFGIHFICEKITSKCLLLEIILLVKSITNNKIQNNLCQIINNHMRNCI